MIRVEAYNKAKDVFHASGVVQLIEENEAEDFARDLAERMASLPPSA